jgi:hypothetical protein
MKMASNTTATTTIIPKLVRLLSTVHVARREGKTTSEIIINQSPKVFSKRNFPTTFAITCGVSFFVGYHGMKSYAEYHRHLANNQNQKEELLSWQQ